MPLTRRALARLLLALADWQIDRARRDLDRRRRYRDAPHLVPLPSIHRIQRAHRRAELLLRIVYRLDPPLP